MQRLEQFQLLMQELGPLSDAVTAIDQVGEDTWLLAYGPEDIVVAVWVDNELAKATLRTEIGAPEKDRRLATYEALLAYNALGAQTGGVKMALQQPAGLVIQEYDMHLANVELNSFYQALSDFVEKARHWIDLLRSGGVDVGDIDVGDANPSRTTGLPRGFEMAP